MMLSSLPFAALSICLFGAPQKADSWSQAVYILASGQELPESPYTVSSGGALAATRSRLLETAPPTSFTLAEREGSSLVVAVGRQTPLLASIGEAAAILDGMDPQTGTVRFAALPKRIQVELGRALPPTGLTALELAVEAATHIHLISTRESGGFSIDSRGAIVPESGPAALDVRPSGGIVIAGARPEVLEEALQRYAEVVAEAKAGLARHPRFSGVTTPLAYEEAAPAEGGPLALPRPWLASAVKAGLISSSLAAAPDLKYQAVCSLLLVIPADRAPERKRFLVYSSLARGSTLSVAPSSDSYQADGFQM